MNLKQSYTHVLVFFVETHICTSADYLINFKMHLPRFLHTFCRLKMLRWLLCRRQQLAKRENGVDKFSSSFLVWVAKFPLSLRLRGDHAVIHVLILANF